MPKIRIDAYYDVTCDACGRSWSTDFNARAGRMATLTGDGGMGMALSRSGLSKAAYAYGWKCVRGRTLCPDCVKKPPKEEII